MKKRPLSGEEEKAIRDIISEFGRPCDFFSDSERKRVPENKKEGKKQGRENRRKSSDEERGKRTRKAD